MGMVSISRRVKHLPRRSSRELLPIPRLGPLGPGGAKACPSRGANSHIRQVSMSNPFEVLREAVKRREPCWNPTGEKIPIAFRFMELAGEAGEAANAGKKLARKELGLVGGSDDLTNLKEELGDVIICCELIAQHYGI